jgi:hypothetical protein
MRLAKETCKRNNAACVTIIVPQSELVWNRLLIEWVIDLSHPFVAWESSDGAPYSCSCRVLKSASVLIRQRQATVAATGPTKQRIG